MGKIIKRVSLIWWRYLVVGAFFGLIGYNISVPIINNIIDNNETAKFYGQLISVVLLGLNYVINNKLNVVRAVVQFWIIISVSFTLINLFDFTANLQNLFSIIIYNGSISLLLSYIMCFGVIYMVMGVTLNSYNYFNSRNSLGIIKN